MSDSRPAVRRPLEFHHRYGLVHGAIINDPAPDEDYHNKISNRGKSEYICKSNNISPVMFNVELPVPFEDWASSDDLSKVTSALYFMDLRAQFYGRLMKDDPELRNSSLFSMHAEAEFWAGAANFFLNKKTTGKLVVVDRVLH